jgi:hypothetical protein
VALLWRLLIILFYAVSTAVLFYAIRRRNGTYHLVGIIAWCIHVLVFTGVTLLYAMDITTILGPKGLNLWSMTVRLHGGLLVFSLGLHYASKKELIH